MRRRRGAPHLDVHVIRAGKDPTTRTVVDAAIDWCAMAYCGSERTERARRRGRWVARPRTVLERSVGLAEEQTRGLKAGRQSDAHLSSR